MDGVVHTVRISPVTELGCFCFCFCVAARARLIGCFLSHCFLLSGPRGPVGSMLVRPSWPMLAYARSSNSMSLLARALSTSVAVVAALAAASSDPSASSMLT